MNAHVQVVLLLTSILVFPLRAMPQQLAFPTGDRGFISGRVLLSPGGLPAQGASVKLTMSTGGFRTTVMTDGNGDFQFSGLPSGTYLLAVEELGFDSIQETVQIGFGGDPELTLHLRKIGGPPPGQGADLVSVRELGIPPKAAAEFQKGLQRRDKNDFAGSLRHFQRAVEVFPTYYEAYLQMGFAYRHLGQNEEAENSVRTSIYLSRDTYADADFTLGEILAGQKQFSEAEQAARQGLVLKPASWAGHYILAWSLFALNRFREAEVSARKVLSLKRDFAKAHLLLANIHLRTHDEVSVVKDLDAYLSLDPGGAASVEARRLLESVEGDLARRQNSLPLAAAIP